MKSIRTSVWIRVTVILLAILISGGITISGVLSINKTNQLFKQATALHSTSLESEKAHYLFLVNLQSAINYGTDFRPKDYQTCVLGTFIYSDVSKYASVYPEIYSLLEIIKPLHREIHECADQILAIKDTNPDQAKELYKEIVTPKVASMVEELDKFVTNSQKVLDEEAARLDVNIKVTACFTIICTAISLFASFLLIRYVIPRIVDPLIEVTRFSKRLEDGDLNFEINIGNNPNEVGMLADALNGSVAQLQSYVTAIRKSMAKMVNGDLTVEKSVKFKGEFKVIQNSILNFEKMINNAFVQIRRSSEQVSAASLQVSGSSQLLAEGSIQQSASINELLSTIQDITIRIKKNTGSASDASALVQNVGESMVISNDKMAEMIRAMDDISKHSEKIYNMIESIEEITVQTNILALNVAVEAASAGEAGKGFAAVAVEVRGLAEKTSKIAQDSTQLIKDTIHSVENGMSKAQIAAELLENSVEGARKVSTTISEISEESGRQSQAVSEILEGMSRISVIVQNNTAVAEQSAAISEELEQQAAILQNMIKYYKLNEDLEIQYDEQDDCEIYTEEDMDDMSMEVE